VGLELTIQNFKKGNLSMIWITVGLVNDHRLSASVSHQITAKSRILSLSPNKILRTFTENIFRKRNPRKSLDSYRVTPFTTETCMNVVIQPRGNLDLKAAAMLQQNIARLAWEKYNRWFIDLGEVTTVSHSGLMALITANKLANKTGRRLSLCNLKSTVMYLLEITELDHKLDILSQEETPSEVVEKIVF
jgi:anti-sigma B factor antagonist